MKEGRKRFCWIVLMLSAAIMLSGQSCDDIFGGSAPSTGDSAPPTADQPPPAANNAPVATDLDLITLEDTTLAITLAATDADGTR